MISARKLVVEDPKDDRWFVTTNFSRILTDAFQPSGRKTQYTVIQILVPSGLPANGVQYEKKKIYLFIFQDDPLSHFY